MPRKSAVSLAVMPPTLPGERPAPPATLDDTEVGLWKAIVGALPPSWLDAASQEILTRAVAQASVCDLQESQLRTLRAQQPPDVDAIGALAAQHAASAKSLGNLLGLLRATPRARMLQRGASRQIAQTPRNHGRPQTMARRRTPKSSGDRPTGGEVITFIEKFLRIPDGPHAGQPLILAPWQKQEILRIYDGRVRRAIISTPKKNGKTGLCAALLLNHLVERTQSSQRAAVLIGNEPGSSGANLRRRAQDDPLE